MTEKMYAPKLRFGSGELIPVGFDSLVKIKIGLTHTPKYVPSGQPFLSSKNISKGFIDFEDIKYMSEEEFNSLPGGARPNVGDILFTRVGSNLGNPIVLEDARPFGIFVSLGAITVNKGTNNYFIKYWMDTSYFWKQVEQKVAGGAKNNLNTSWLKEFKLAIPPIEEQQKIASFFVKVHKKIELLTEKKNKLTKYKKGVMQQLFNVKFVQNTQDGKTNFIPPTLRFKTDDGSDFPEWRQNKIGVFGSFYYGKSAPKWSLTEGATIPCVRYGELYSKFQGTVDQIYSYTSIPRDKLKFSKGGEVLVPRVGENPLEFAKCSYLPISDVAIGEMISVFNSDEDGQFMATYFRATCQNKFAKLVEGGNVSNLYFRYLENVNICIPIKEEQLKISSFINTLNEKIDLVEAELIKVKEWKKGLLQQMFV